MVPFMVKPTLVRTKSEILQQAKDFLDEFYETRKRYVDLRLLQHGDDTKTKYFAQ